MITGKTENGFEFSYDERILKDWRFVNAIAETQSASEVKKLQGITALTALLLGEQGNERLTEFVAARNDGFAPVDAVMAEITAILESSKDLKNSHSSATASQ